MRSGDIQWSHDQLELAGPAAIDNLLSCVGVGETVEFGCGRGVSWVLERSTHPDDRLNPLERLGIGSESMGQVCHFGISNEQ